MAELVLELVLELAVEALVVASSAYGSLPSGNSCPIKMKVLSSQSMVEGNQKGRRIRTQRRKSAATVPVPGPCWAR